MADGQQVTFKPSDIQGTNTSDQQQAQSTSLLNQPVQGAAAVTFNTNDIDKEATHNDQAQSAAPEYQPGAYQKRVNGKVMTFNVNTPPEPMPHIGGGAGRRGHDRR